MVQVVSITHILPHMIVGHAPVVRVQGFDLAAREPDRPGRGRRAEEEEGDLGIVPDPVGHEERRRHGVQQEVHASAGAGEIVQGERGRRDGPVADNEESPHVGGTRSEERRVGKECRL